MASPHIEVSPNPALIDERLTVRLSGFAQGQRVTLRASQPDDGGQRWLSSVTFEANAEGSIDLTADAPVSGSYSGVEPMGIVWSMSPEHGKRGLGGSIEPLALSLTAEVEGQAVAAASVTRLRVAPDVKKTVVRDNGLFANFFEPATPGKYPAMIVVSGSGGGLSDSRAALLASHGIAALSLAYFAYEGLPKGLVNIPLEYFETAIQWLQAQSTVDPERIGVTGGSRGGELSLLLGAMFPQIKAVVAYVPSGVLWGGFGGDEAVAAAWTYKGKPLAYVPTYQTPEVTALMEDAVKNKAPIPLTPSFHSSYDALSDLNEVIIPVEKTNGPILLISGEDDQMWPSTRFGDIAMNRLRAHNFPHRFEHLHYADAGHATLSPYVPTTINYLSHPVDGNLYAVGGLPKAQADANEHSWEQLLRFLYEAFGIA
jgi:dienelactone hydrolase